MNSERLSLRRTGHRWERSVALVLVGLALWIRSYGLSHDFELGKIYHPDTPKQVHAARRFSAGKFYRKTGNRDIDGYPFFTSLIAAGIYRAAQGTAETAARHLGLRYDAENLWREPRAVEWIMRWLNVLLSSFAVWLLFSLARRFSLGPFALLPAALFCFSPLDVAACHYASGDTAAAFFGLVALLFSLRILDRGGALDYMVASAACVCSFSAKYHGGMLAFPLMVAHALRVSSFRALFAPASTRRVLLVLTTVIVVFFLTNPSTIVRTSDAFRDIFNFIFTAGRKGVLGIPRHSAWSPHFLLAKFTINAPVLAEFMSPVLLAFACIGIVLALLRVEKPRIVLATLPVAYALFGLSPKTADNPVYSTLVTPALFLLGSLALRDLARCRILAPLPRLSAPACAITAAAMLINATAREMFFFWHRDTRVLANAWVRENVPASFEITGGPYSLLDPDLSVRSEPFAGSAFVRSSPRTPVPEATIPVCTIWLEDKPLPLFRNFTTSIYLRSPWIREGWTLPVYQKIPSSIATELILADGDEFWRSPRLFSVYPNKPLKKTVLSQQRLEEIAVRIRCGPLPTWCEVEVGGKRLREFLEADSQKWWLIRNPRVGFPFLKKGYLYH
ncbi:MAG: ArnT family glycosyltransferase, partial [Kiritimatiellia bacterium]